MLDTLKKLVEFYPITDDQVAVGRLLDYAEQRLAKNGLVVQRFNFEGTQSLVAATHGGKHSRVMLQGHVDVVPGEGQPFRRDGDRVYGRGVFDMLFGTAAFLELVDELDPVANGYNLSVMLVGDEEHGGFNGAQALLNEGYSADVCILPDAGNNFGTLSVGAKGVYQPIIRINGRSHHSSRPWEGDGANAKLVHFLAAFEQVFDTRSRDNSTMTIARLNGGAVLNQGPGTAVAGLDIRYKDKADLNRIQASLAEILANYDGEIVQEYYAHDFQLDASNHDVRRFIALYEAAHGAPIEQITSYGSSDARFFSAHNIPVIMFRPDGSEAHGDDEWISASSCQKFYELLRRYLVATFSTLPK